MRLKTKRLFGSCRVLKFRFLLALAALPAGAADIALDVGHSLKSPGATSASGIKEIELNRRLAQDVAVRLKRAGIGYRLIGDDGKMDVLTDRTEAAGGERLFLSFHHDSLLPDWQARAVEFSGFSLFVSRKNPRLKESLSCAQKLGVKLIESGFKPSRYHAVPVEGENRPFADEMRGVHYFDDLVVLKTANQPAVLIEAGVIVNPLDEQRVSGQEGRGRLADAIASGAVECLTLLE
ncbi:MAG: N-acetylmuramoyl-L-alanine amidase [Gammaproteobacteria bacterium]